MAVPTESATANWTTDEDRNALLEQTLGRLTAFWNRPLLRSSTGLFAVILLCAVLCGLRAWIGMIGSRDFTHDGFMLFDGAWRMLCGQLPHRDFYSHVGFLTYLPTAVGLWLSRGTAWGLGYGQALTGFALGLWALLLSRKRLSDVPAVLMSVTVVLIAIAPFAIGFSPMKPSPGMIYNRQGYALLALILVEAFESARQTSPKTEFWGGFSSGAVLSIAFFLKITYFAIGGFLLLALVVCRPQTRQRWIGIASGFLAISFACCAYFRFAIGPMLHDLLTVGGGKHIRIGWYMLDSILGGALLIVGFGAACALFLLACKEPRSSRHALVLSIAVALAGIFVILTNYEQNGTPMAVFVAILLLDRVASNSGEGRVRVDYFRTGLVLIGSAVIIASLLGGAIGMGFALGQRAIWLHRPSFKMARLSGFSTGPDDDWYAGRVNNGLPLIEKYRRPGDTLMSLDFTNPYSYSLGMRPAPGGTTVFQYGTTFNDKSKPAPEFLFGQADLVAVPVLASDPTLDENVPRLYGKYLNSHFHLLGETKYWRLYRRDGE